VVCQLNFSVIEALSLGRVSDLFEYRPLVHNISLPP